MENWLFLALLALSKGGAVVLSPELGIWHHQAVSCPDTALGTDFSDLGSDPCMKETMSNFYIKN